MRVPAPVLRGVRQALEEELGGAVEIRSTTSVGGGCINPSARLETTAGEAFFLKWNPSAPVEMFAAEADGLEGLEEGARSTPLRIPKVLGWGGAGTEDEPGWLLLEFVPRGSAGRDYGRRLGEGLARLHGAGGNEEEYGWRRDNFIGSLPQGNGPLTGWPAFWRDRRLAPQLAMARERGHFTGARGDVLDDLLDRLEDILEAPVAGGPALLHGDLWSGNYYPGPAGGPVLIDPAVYRGVGEVDLAMMELFGSFPSGFREAYREARALEDTYDLFLRDLYQLYYLLVHVNLFGGGYVGSSLSAARRVLLAT